MRPDRSSSWTARSVAVAFLVSAAAMAAAIFLTHLGVWPAIDFTQTVAGALAGTIYLARRHPENSLLPFLIFLPVSLFMLVLFGSTIGLPIERLFWKY